MIVFLIGGCKREEKHLSDEEATEIIRKFGNSNYEYIITTFRTNNGQREVVNEAEGVIIAEPYEQYEKVIDSEAQGMTEQYWCNKNGDVEYYIAVQTNPEEKQWMLMGDDATKGSDLYSRNDLKFQFDRTEYILDNDVDVYQAKYQTTSSYQNNAENSTEQTEITYTITVEYFIESKTEKILQIGITNDSGKEIEIMNQMNIGMSQKEAEDFVEENGYEKVEQTIEIKKSGSDVKIPQLDITK